MLASMRHTQFAVRKFLGAVGALTLVAATGCTMCPPGYIDDYATIGGKWQRTNPTDGRVGSPFSDGVTNFGADQVPSQFVDGEAIYQDEIIDGTEFDSYGGQQHDSEPYYEDSIEVVPQYETLGEDW